MYYSRYTSPSSQLQINPTSLCCSGAATSCAEAIVWTQHQTHMDVEYSAAVEDISSVCSHIEIHLRYSLLLDQKLKLFGENMNDEVIPKWHYWDDRSDAASSDEPAIAYQDTCIFYFRF